MTSQENSIKCALAKLPNVDLLVVLSGAHVVGINCNFGPPTCLETIKAMKEALKANDLYPYLMTQPLGFLTPEVRSGDGLHHLPEHFLEVP